MWNPCLLCHHQEHIKPHIICENIIMNDIPLDLIIYTAFLIHIITVRYKLNIYALKCSMLCYVTQKDTHTYANTMRNPELLGGPAKGTPNSAGRNPQQALRPCSRKGGDSTSSINQHQAGLNQNWGKLNCKSHYFTLLYVFSCHGTAKQYSHQLSNFLL